MGNLRTLFKKDLTAGLRTNSYLIIGAITLFFAGLAPVMTKLMPELFRALGDQFSELAGMFSTPAPADAFLQMASNVTQITLFAIIVLFVVAPLKERKKGTYSFLKQSGVGDAEFILSHFLTDALALLGVTILCGGVFSAATVILIGTFSVANAVLSFACIFLFFLSFEALSLLVSCFLKTPTQGMVFGFVLYFLMSIFEMFDKISWLLPTHLAQRAADVIRTGPDQNLFISFGAAAVITVVCVTLSCMLFGKVRKTSK